MFVTFIGTGCGIPSKKRGPASLLINVENDLLWFDTGAGSLRRLIEAGFNYQDIDYIIYTHFHLDHTGDLASFLFASKYPLAIRQKDLNIIGPQGILELYDNLLELYGKQIQELPYNVNITELVGQGFSLAKSKPEGLPYLNTIKTAHTSESQGYKLTDKVTANAGSRYSGTSKSIVYTGDTEYFDELIEFASGVDLLILECSFPHLVPGHLNPEQVGEIAEKARVKQVAVTHLYPICEPENLFNTIRKKYSGKIIIPEDLMRLEV